MKKTSLFFILLIISNFCFGQYYTGQRVFSKKFLTESKDYNLETSIKIKNTSGDIIVAVEDIYLKKVIQHAYLKSYDIYTFKNIPYGKCL